MDSIGIINARYRRMINLAHPRSDRDAVNFYTCRALLSMWMPKTKDEKTNQVSTSLNDSILTGVLDPIESTDGVNKQYLVAKLKDLESKLDVIIKEYIEAHLKDLIESRLDVAITKYLEAHLKDLVNKEYLEKRMGEHSYNLMKNYLTKVTIFDWNTVGNLTHEEKIEKILEIAGLKPI